MPGLSSVIPTLETSKLSTIGLYFTSWPKLSALKVSFCYCPVLIVCYDVELNITVNIHLLHSLANLKKCTLGNVLSEKFCIKFVHIMIPHSVSRRVRAKKV